MRVATFLLAIVKKYPPIPLNSDRGGYNDFDDEILLRGCAMPGKLPLSA